MPEPAGDKKRLLPRRYQMSDVRVPKIMEANMRQLAPGNPAIEHLGDALGIQRSAGSGGKHEVVVDVSAAHNEELLADDPTKRIELPRVTSKLPRPIKDSDLEQALEQADPLMRFWLLLAAFEGLRCQEISGLDREDVLEDDGALRIVFGKGAKERMLPLHPAVLEALMALPMPATGALFCSPKLGERYQPYYVSQLMGRHLRTVTGLEHIGAHALRHFFAIRCYRTNQDPLLTQKLLGHASPNSTQVYAAADPGSAAPTVNNLRVYREAQ